MSRACAQPPIMLPPRMRRESSTFPIFAYAFIGWVSPSRSRSGMNAGISGPVSRTTGFERMTRV